MFKLISTADQKRGAGTKWRPCPAQRAAFACVAGRDFLGTMSSVGSEWTSRQDGPEMPSNGEQQATPGAFPQQCNLTAVDLLAALRALERGDVGARLPDHLCGVEGELAATFNRL